MPGVWKNWSENLQFTPASLPKPSSEAELSRIVRRAASEQRCVRVVGAGHSMPPLVVTPDVLVSLDNLQGVIDHDAKKGQATVWAGTRLHQLGEQLHQRGLAMENYGDVNYQAVAGAFGTGTHGSGGSFGILSTQAIGFRIMTASGDVVECSTKSDKTTFRAAQVALGTLGIFTQIKLRLEPTYKLRRREWCVHADEALQHLDRHVSENRNFDFYWFPRRDEIKLRTLNPPDHEPNDLTPRSNLARDETDWSHEIIPRPQEFKYIEMEYAVPAEHGPQCFQEIRDRIKQRHRRNAAWRVLYRTVKQDDSYLSIAAGRDTVTMAILQNNMLPYEDYFTDIEAIFARYQGRPHWGKMHWKQAKQLKPLYRNWNRFQKVRRQLDPDGVFLNGYMRSLFGE